jgi:ketosteroid isomerase-like protein
MSSEDLEGLRRGYEAFSAGDLNAVVMLIDPDVEVEIHTGRPDLPAAGAFRGHVGFLENLGQLANVFDDVRVEPEEFIETGKDYRRRPHGRARKGERRAGREPGRSRRTLHEAKAVRFLLRRRSVILALLTLTLIVPIGCGDDSASRKGPQRLSAAENSTVRRAQVSVQTYCAKLALYLAGRRDAPTSSETQRVDDDLDELIALAKKKPEGRSQSEDTTRQVLGDMTEDLEGSHCSGSFAQKLDRALGELPPEQ